MEPVELVMVLDNMSWLPRFPAPSGYSFRRYEEGDGELWAGIETSAGEFDSTGQAFEHFRIEFGEHEQELRDRCIFIEDENGQSIGTAMAWYGTLLAGGLAGRLHWVGIREEYQGRGLGKPLVSRAMELLCARHDLTYLTTQRRSLIAIKIYLDFGFVPHITDGAQQKDWHFIAKQLGISEPRSSL